MQLGNCLIITTKSVMLIKKPFGLNTQQITHCHHNQIETELDGLYIALSHHSKMAITEVVAFGCKKSNS